MDLEPSTLASAALDAERALHDPAVRRRRDRVEALLDGSFREIGRSGTLWTRAATVAALGAEPAHGPTHGARMTEVHASHPADDLVLLTYTLDVAGDVTRRSSLWRVHGSTTTLLFHQGTPVP